MSQSPINAATAYKRELRARQRAGDFVDRRRRYATPEEAAKARLEKRREVAQKARREAGIPERLPRATKPRRETPARATTTHRRTVVTDAITPSSIRHASVDRAALPDSAAFIRAHPDRYEVLPMDHPWSTAETLSASHRKAIQGVA